MKKIAVIFPEVNPGTLCKLADLVTSKPLAVLELVSEATTKQLLAFDGLIESTFVPNKVKVDAPHQCSIICP